MCKCESCNSNKNPALTNKQFDLMDRLSDVIQELIVECEDDRTGKFNDFINGLQVFDFSDGDLNEILMKVEDNKHGDVF